MKLPSHFVTLVFSLTATLSSAAPSVAPQVGNVAGVKTYLLGTLAKMDKAAADFLADAATYAKIIDADGGDYAKALGASRGELRALVARLRDEYMAMDSNG